MMYNTHMKNEMVTRLLFRLLPMQVFLALVATLNSIISGLFASNYVGTAALTAIGLYNPINLFIFAASTMFVGGATIVCGKYMGRSEQDKVQNVFSVANMLALIFSTVMIAFLLIIGMFDLSGFLVKEEAVRPLFNAYVCGQAVGIVPLLLGNIAASFLSLENKAQLSTIASAVYVIVNLILNYVFVYHFRMGALGLALASSLGLWVFFAAQAWFFLTPSCELRFFSRKLDWNDSIQIFRIGIPGAATYGYQTIRSLIVNYLLGAYVGAEGISAFTASDTLLRFGWAIPTGMIAVSRMLISISIGEEDRQTLTDVMRNMFKRYLPLLSAVCAVIICCAVPLTRMYYRDMSDPIFMMTAWGFRLLPLCMPLSLIMLHFVCYAQSSGRQVYANVLSCLDGVVDVAVFMTVLIPFIGMNSVYIANVLNGVVTVIAVVVYSVIKKKRIPRNMDDLMVIPDDFGASEDDRMDVSVREESAVVTISGLVQKFCEDHGIDKRRSYIAALFLEEMAGNIVSHGFSKDNKEHSVDIRVVHKDNDVILRIKDDCRPFDPSTRREITDPEDVTRNIGIRMVYKLATDIEYKNMLGMNVLTARI